MCAGSLSGSALGGSISVTKQSIQEWVERETLGYSGDKAKTSAAAWKALKGCFLTGCGLPLEREYYLYEDGSLYSGAIAGSQESAESWSC